MSTLPSQYPIAAREKLWQLQGLGEDISKLAGGVHHIQAHLAVLDRFVREVLADVDVLLPPVFPNDML